METSESTVEDDLYSILKPAIEKINIQVSSVRLSQVALREKIDIVAAELQRMSEEQPASVDLAPYIRRLTNTKRRLVLASNIAQNTHDRLSRLHQSAEAETLQKQAIVEAQQALIDVARQPQ